MVCQNAYLTLARAVHSNEPPSVPKDPPTEQSGCLHSNRVAQAEGRFD